MYLAVDVGATKTLVAIFSGEGDLRYVQKFPTNPKYDQFLDELRLCLQQDVFKESHLRAACIAIPGKVDRKTGVGLTFGNLTWKNAAIKDDLAKILGHIDIFVDNDANLAGLYEALTVGRHYRKVLYLTVGTGIGDGVITGGKIDPDFADSESGQMVLEHDDKLQKWEAFASGEAFHKRYGRLATEVNNPYIWQQYTRGLAKGVGELMATLQPDVIIFGGGIGAHLENFKEFLLSELRKYESDLVKIPPIIKADKPEEAVIYGCYRFIKQHHR